MAAQSFFLRHQICDKNLQPVAAAKLVLTASPANLDVDGVSYAPAPKVTTDAEGHLKVVGAAEPDVELVIGPQYTIQSAPGSPAFLELRRWTAVPPLVSAGGTLLLSTLPIELPVPPTSLADEVARVFTELGIGPGANITDPRFPEGTVLPLRADWDPEWFAFLLRDSVTGAVIDWYDKEGLPA